MTKNKTLPGTDMKRYGVVKVITREVIAYPWDDWFREAQVILKRGVNYSIETVKMIQQIRNKAIEMGLTVSFKSKYDMISITVWDRVKQPLKKGR